MPIKIPYDYAEYIRQNRKSRCYVKIAALVRKGDISDLDQDQWNLNIGFSYKVNDAVYLTGSYNYTNSSANGGTGLAEESRKYSQNRASLGVRYEF